MVAALLGGGAALGGAYAVGGLGNTTTVVRQVAAPAAAPVAFQQGKHRTINQIYRQAAPGVVHITSTSKVQAQPDPFGGNPFGGQETQQALGSGFVIDKAGHIVTNYHVVQGASSVQVSFSNNESLEARIVGVDPATDVAVLQVNASSRALRVLSLGDSDDVQVGDEVIAIGNPFGLDRSVTSGIVSAVQRSIQAPNPASTIDHAIQTDAALNHGNSGGPLLNAQGDVIGVNAQIQTGGTSDGNVGIGFAIPINTVKDVAAQLIVHGRVEHPFLGIQARAIEPQIAQLFHLPVTQGLLVTKVLPHTGASDAGLEGGTTPVVVAGESWPAGGDVIVKADGQPVATVERLRDLIAAKKPGDSLKLELYRGKDRKTVTVKLGRQQM